MDTLPVLLVSVAALTALCCAPSVNFQPHDERYGRCAARVPATLARQGDVSVTGTIIDIVDGTAVDGSANMVVADGAGDLVKASLPPALGRREMTPDARSCYRELSGTQRGDCVFIRGVRADGGRVLITRFDNLDRN
jgi:hypothetical protein